MEDLVKRHALRAVCDTERRYPCCCGRCIRGGPKGLNGQVLLQDQLNIEWTYGKDPYPPHSSDFLGPYGNAETPAIESGVPGEQHLG